MPVCPLQPSLSFVDVSLLRDAALRLSARSGRAVCASVYYAHVYTLLVVFMKDACFFLVGGVVVIP